MYKSPRERVRVLDVLGVLVGVVAGGCVYNADSRCGPAMTFVDSASACVCDNNAVPIVGGCRPCADDEIASGAVCMCAAGQTKNADNICVTIAGLGDVCDAATMPCTDATYSYCAAGTCTERCTTNADCDSAYTCATWEPQPYCRTFEGLGASCVTSADCSGDANFCDTFQTHSCGIAGCSLTADDCPRDSQCCDFSSYGLGTLCAGACQ